MGSMDTMKGLQINPIRLNDDALGTLAADTALIINQEMSGALTRSFLLKQLQYCFTIAIAGTAESVIFGLANGSATIGEIEDALRLNVEDPDDASSPAVQAQKQIVLWESLRLIDLSGGNDFQNDVIKMGGGKGIPLKEATGVQIFVYNPSTASLTTGSTVTGLVILKGVWLND